MMKLRTRKALFGGLAALALLLGAGLYAVAQQTMEEAKRDRAVSMGGGKFHVLAATLETTQWGWLDPKEPPKLVVNSGDTVAVETQQDPARHDHGRDRRAAKGQSGRGTALRHGAHLRQRRGARRRDGDPLPQDRAQGLRGQLQPAGQGIPHDRRAGARDARRVHQVLLPRLGEAHGRVQAGGHDRSAALPRHLRRGHRPEGSLAPQGRLDRSHGSRLHAPALEERLEHGHQRDPGGVRPVHPHLRQGRARVDG